jgi:hypothetical protein
MIPDDWRDVTLEIVRELPPSWENVLRLEDWAKAALEAKDEGFARFFRVTALQMRAHLRDHEGARWWLIYVSVALFLLACLVVAALNHVRGCGP